MRITINKFKLRIYIGTLLFILSGHLYLLMGQSVERILLLSSIPFFYKEFNVIFRRSTKYKINYIHHCFIVCILADVIFYINTTPIVYAGGMLYIWLLTFKIFPYIAQNIGMKFYQWIYKVNLYFSIVVLIVCPIFQTIQLTNYSGIFGNSNGLGNYASFVIALIFPLIIERLNEKQSNKKYEFVFLLISLLLAIFFIVISSSRTAFLTFAIEFVFFLFVILISIFKKHMKRAYFKKVFFGSIGGLFLIVIVLLYTDFIEILNNAIFKKFTYLSNNQLNGRSEIWEYIWTNSRLFENGVKSVEAAHNVYFGLIDQFGKLSGILYLLFITCNFIKMIIFVLSKDTSKWKYYALFAGIAFLSVSMAESYLLTSTMLWFYIMIPIQEIVTKRNFLNK